MECYNRPNHMGYKTYEDAVDKKKISSLIEKQTIN